MIINYGNCIEACQQCLIDYQNCLIKMTGMKSDDDCPKCCALCVDACLVCLKFMIADGPLTKEYCRLCAEICEWCGGQCQQHDHDHCKTCAESCFKCAQECRKLIA